MTKWEYEDGLFELNQKFSRLLDNLVAVCRDYQHIFEYLASKKNENYDVLNQQSGINDFIKIVNVFKEDNNEGVCIRKVLHRNKKLAAWGIHIITHKQQKLDVATVNSAFDDQGLLFSHHLGKVKEDLAVIKAMKKALQLRFDPYNNYKLIEHMIIDNWCENASDEKCACEGGSCGFECICVCHKDPNSPTYTANFIEQFKEPATKECSSCCKKNSESTCSCSNHKCDGTCKQGK